MSRRSSVIRRESAEAKPPRKQTSPGRDPGAGAQLPLSCSLAPVVCRQRLRGAHLRDRLVSVVATGDRLLGRIAGIASRGLHGRAVSGQRRSAEAGFHAASSHARLRASGVGDRGVRDHRAVRRPLGRRAFTSPARGQQVWLGLVLRGAVAAVCLLPPTFLMGASLPAIARWVETTPQGVSWLGLLYSANVAGAVTGCVLAGFYLLRVHDMAFATYTAAAINVAVALLALALASRAGRWNGSGCRGTRRRSRARARRDVRLRRDCVFRTDRAGRRSGVDAAALAAAGRDGLHFLDYSGGVSHRPVGRQRRWFFPGPPRARPSAGAGRLPDPAGPRDRLDRLHAGARAALLARRSVAFDSIPGSISIWT